MESLCIHTQYLTGWTQGVMSTLVRVTHVGVKFLEETTGVQVCASTHRMLLTAHVYTHVLQLALQ